LFLRNAWWWIDYTGADGKRHRKKATPNYQTAKLVYRDTMAKIARGEVLGVREEGIRVKEFVDRHYWPAVKATLAPVWAQRSRYILDAVLLPVFGGTKLSRLRQQDVERWYGERLSEVKPSTANKELARLKHLLGRAVKWAYLKTSPAKDVTRAKEPDGRVRYLTSEEREKLLNGAHETVESKDGRRWTVHHKPGAALRPYVLAALQTGARRAELLRLTWGDVDMKRRTVTFRKTKNGRDRTVPMTETLREMLQTLPRPLDPTTRVLPAYEPLALTRSFTRLAKQLGLAPLTCHDLRHDAASTLTMAGESQRAIMEILGHRDPRMTTRYQHLAPGHLHEAIRALEQPSKGQSESVAQA